VTVTIVLVTHEQLGAQLLTIADTILCQSPLPIKQVSVPANISAELLGKYADLIRAAMLDQNDGAGVLVLTDIHGATPDNLARHFGAQCNARVVSGVNLPMLLRVLNYRQQTLQQLCETASSGGRSGIQLCENRSSNL
jgi:PTS system ascorbate-specific IIA component